MSEAAPSRRPSALANPNFRRYELGQGLSHTGGWMQQVSELWFVLLITDSATALGIVTALRFGPLLLLGAYGGLISDRFDRRRLMFPLALLKVAGAVALLVLARREDPALVAVYALILLQGMLAVVENPARRSFVRDLVDDRTLAQAISLNATVVTSSRTIGPALGGILIARAGVAWCFGIAATSYLAVVISLLMLDRSELRPQVIAARGPGQIRAGLLYARSKPHIWATLLLTGLVSVFAWNWSVLLPVYAQVELGGGAELYGTLVATLSAGSVMGSALTSRLVRQGRRHLHLTAIAVSASLFVVGLVPQSSVALIALFALGAAAVSFTIGAQSLLQSGIRDEMSGRIMALYSIAWLGSKPIGGLLGGVITDIAGTRMAFIFGSAMVALSVAAMRFAPRSEQRMDG